MIHHEVMYHIVKGKRSAPNNRKTQMQYLKNSKVVWEKMKGKKSQLNRAINKIFSLSTQKILTGMPLVPQNLVHFHAELAFHLSP